MGTKAKNKQMTLKGLKKKFTEDEEEDLPFMATEDIRQAEEDLIESYLADKREERIAIAHPESKYFDTILKRWSYTCPGYKPDGSQCLCIYENQSEEELRLIQRNKPANYNPALDPNRKF